LKKTLIYLNVIFIIITVIVSFSTFFFKFIYPPIPNAKAHVIFEKYDKDLIKINSIEKFDSLVNSNLMKYGDTTRTILFIDDFLKKRFYHSYSSFSFKENWVAVVCSNLFWNNFQFPVAPDDILQHSMAACSQQGILFQDQLHKLKIPYETIAFKSYKNNKEFGHYAVSAFYSNNWHFYDTNQEPVIVDSTMPSIEKIIKTKLYEKMYISPTNISSQYFFKTKSYFRSNHNVYSAPRMYQFHKVSLFLSNKLWLILFIFNIVFWLLSRRYFKSDLR
jgi:hypothetical protein